jgi:uncharacterized protein (TIRG00374 family)
MLSAKVKWAIGLVVRLLIATALILWVLRKANLRTALETLAGTQLWAIVVSLILMFLNMILRAWKWQIFLRAEGVNFSFIKLNVLYMVGTFFNTFLPTSVGGDVKRIYDLATLTSRRSAAMASVMMDRGTAMYIMLVYGVIVILARWDLLGGALVCAPMLTGLLAVVVGAPLAIVLAPVLTRRKIPLVPQSVMRKLDNLSSTLLRLSQKPSVLAATLSISLVCLVIVVAVYWALIVGLGIAAPLEAVIVVVPLVTAITSLPISINGIGLREGAFVYFLSRYGVSASDAMAASLGVFALIVGFGLLGGVVFVFEGWRDPSRWRQNI